MGDDATAESDNGDITITDAIVIATAIATVVDDTGENNDFAAAASCATFVGVVCC